MGADELTSFEREVARVVLAIPRGQVSSYGQVAQRAGRPSCARMVSRVLGKARGLPWWRVVQSGGTLAPQVAPEQARRLRQEGVEVRGRKVQGARAPRKSERPDPASGARPRSGARKRRR